MMNSAEVIKTSLANAYNNILLWTTLTKTPRQHNEMQVVVYHFTLKYI